MAHVINTWAFSLHSTPSNVHFDPRAVWVAAISLWILCCASCRSHLFPAKHLIQFKHNAMQRFNFSFLYGCWMDQQQHKQWPTRRLHHILRALPPSPGKQAHPWTASGLRTRCCTIISSWVLPGLRTCALLDAVGKPILRGSACRFLCERDVKIYLPVWQLTLQDLRAKWKICLHLARASVNIFLIYA